MPRLLAVRSIPLSLRTARSWRSAGVDFWPRSRNLHEILDLEDQDTLVLNLGNSSLPHEITERFTTYNHPETVRRLSSPTLTREYFNDLLPPARPTEPTDFWVKGPGCGGQNKERRVWNDIRPIPHGWDTQAHVEGQEYRVNTTGSRCVQVHKRKGDNSKRSYEWCGLGGAPQTVKSIAREAADATGLSILAWDIILSTEGIAYILEGNTCPGVNPPTARRIVDEIQRSR